MPYKKAERLGSFRRFALAFWRAPRDGVILGTLFLDATKMLELIKKCEAERGIKLTPGHFVGKAMGLGLKASPQLNSKVIWGTIYQKDSIDIFFQVDIESGKDLSGVLVENADKKSVVEIGLELREKAALLRAGKDKQYENTQKGFFKKIPPFVLRFFFELFTFLEFNLGFPPTFLPGYKEDPFGSAMCTNVGMMGVEIAYAPLVPVSRVGVVGLVGKVAEQPVAVNGKVEIRPILTGSATFDHRLGDGAQIGVFIRTARAFIEDPYLDGPPQAPAASQPASTAATNGGSAQPASASNGNGGSATPQISNEPKPLPVV